jgi:hypothetical protein
VKARNRRKVKLALLGFAERQKAREAKRREDYARWAADALPAARASFTGPRTPKCTGTTGPRIKPRMSTWKSAAKGKHNSTPCPKNTGEQYTLPKIPVDQTSLMGLRCDP